MIPRLPVTSIQQCKSNCQEDAYLELFQAIRGVQPIFIDAHHLSNMICKVRSPQSQVKTHSVLEEIITSSNEVYKDFESDMEVGIRKLGSPTRDTVESNLTVQQAAGSSLITLQPQAKKSDL